MSARQPDPDPVLYRRHRGRLLAALPMHHGNVPTRFIFERPRPVRTRFNWEVVPPDDCIVFEEDGVRRLTMTVEDVLKFTYRVATPKGIVRAPRQHGLSAGARGPHRLWRMELAH
jgi:hypothetical protein